VAAEAGWPVAVVLSWRHGRSGVEVADPQAIRAAWRDLGQQLAAKRKAASLSQQDLAERTSYSRSSVANIEIGLQHVNRTFWERVDEQLGTGGVLVRGYDAVEAQHRALQRRRAEPLLAEAKFHTVAPAPREIGSFPLSTVNSPQNDLAFIDNGKLPDSFIDVETHEDLVSIFGGLTAVAESRGWNAVRPLIARNLTAFDRVVHEGGKGGVRAAYAESRWSEFMSGACDNGGAEGGTWLSRAYASSLRAGNHSLASYMLMRKSQRALDNGDARQAVTFSRRALNEENLPPKIRGLCLTRLAEGLALAGDDESLTLAKVAFAEVGGTTKNTEDLIARHCNDRYVLAVRARCHYLLGQSAETLAIIDDILSDPVPAAPVDIGMWMIYRADALAHTDAEQAATAGQQALDLANRGASVRIVRALLPLAVALRQHAGHDGVQAFLRAHRTAFVALLSV
jgi:transcriptional regulator with XRE-family HTH domain